MVKKSNMTLFDTLCSPLFRERPALFIGRGDLESLETWLAGYFSASHDSGNLGILLTPNGISFDLFREYIAYQEKDRSVGGIAYILKQAAGDDEKKAWQLLYSYLDAFMELKVVKRERIAITDQMRAYHNDHMETYRQDSEGKMVRLQYTTTELLKTVLSNGLCYLEVSGYEEQPDGDHSVGVVGHYGIRPEEEVDRAVRFSFGVTDFEKLQIKSE